MSAETPREGRRRTAYAMIGNYKAKFAIERATQCELHDDVIFAIIDGSPTLGTSEEQDDWIVQVMAETAAVFSQYSIKPT